MTAKKKSAVECVPARGDKSSIKFGLLPWKGNKWKWHSTQVLFHGLLTIFIGTAFRKWLWHVRNIYSEWLTHCFQHFSDPATGALALLHGALSYDGVLKEPSWPRAVRHSLCDQAAAANKSFPLRGIVTWGAHYWGELNVKDKSYPVRIYHGLLVFALLPKLTINLLQWANDDTCFGKVTWYRY